MRPENSLITDEVWQIVRSVDWPKHPRKLQVSVDEGEFNIWLVLWRDNFESFDGEEKRHIAGLVGWTIKKIRDLGIPCYLDVEPGSRDNGNSLDFDR